MQRPLSSSHLVPSTPSAATRSSKRTTSSPHRPPLPPSPTTACSAPCLSITPYPNPFLNSTSPTSKPKSPGDLTVRRFATGFVFISILPFTSRLHLASCPSIRPVLLPLYASCFSRLLLAVLPSLPSHFPSWSFASRQSTQPLNRHSTPQRWCLPRFCLTSCCLRTPTTHTHLHCHARTSTAYTGQTSSCVTWSGFPIWSLGPRCSQPIYSPRTQHISHLSSSILA